MTPRIDDGAAVAIAEQNGRIDPWTLVVDLAAQHPRQRRLPKIVGQDTMLRPLRRLAGVRRDDPDSRRHRHARVEECREQKLVERLGVCCGFVAVFPETEYGDVATGMACDDRTCYFIHCGDDGSCCW